MRKIAKTSKEIIANAFEKLHIAYKNKNFSGVIFRKRRKIARYLLHLPATRWRALFRAIHGNSKCVKCELNISDILGEKSQHQTSVPEFPVARRDRSGLAGVKVPFASCSSTELCTNSALSRRIVCALQTKHTQELCQDPYTGF